MNKYTELKIIALINIYEYIFGVIIGIILNLSIEYFIPYHNKETFGITILILLLLIIPVTTLVLYMR